MKTLTPPMLENIEQDIPRLFQRLNLAFLQDDAARLNACLKNNGRFFNSVVKRNNDHLILKIRLQKDEELARDIEREIKLLKFFKNNPLGDNVVFPGVVDFGEFMGLQWYLRQFQTGILAGQMEENHGFLAKFFDKVSPSELAGIINSYQSFEPEKTKHLPLHRHGWWWYRQDFEFYKKNFLNPFVNSPINDGLLDEADIEEADKILKSGESFLDSEAEYLCHGDLYPNNILITPKNKITIFDWGISNFNNRSFDIAFIYFDAWRNEEWRKKMLGSYVSGQSDSDRENFVRLFRISLISLATRFSGHCWRLITSHKSPKAGKNKMRPLLANHLSTLKAALYNFSSIL